MKNEISVANIEVKQNAVFVVNGLDKMKTDVERLVNEMKTITVTEETIANNKKLLSAIRNQFSAINAERIALKNKLLVDYDVLAGEIKDIENILSVGETHIREQVRNFEKEQLELRMKAVEDEYSHYHSAYKAPSWYTFSDFYRRNPRTTNKSVSKKFIRESIITWFEGYKNAYETVNEYSDSDITRKALIALYRESDYNINVAIEKYERQQQYMREAEEKRKLNVVTGVNKHQKQAEEVSWKAIEVQSTDLVKALQVLKQNGINVRLK